MNKKTDDKKIDMETVLQNAVDELFALQKAAEEAHQKFLAESVTLIKASYKQVDDSAINAARAEKVAWESTETAIQMSHAAKNLHTEVKLWHRAAFWLALGYLSIGIYLGWTYFNLGKQITIRTYEVASLQAQNDALTAELKRNTKKRQAAQNENGADTENHFEGGDQEIN
jgi:hypothetical protein